MPSSPNDVLHVSNCAVVLTSCPSEDLDGPEAHWDEYPVSAHPEIVDWIDYQSHDGHGARGIHAGRGWTLAA